MTDKPPLNVADIHTLLEKLFSQHHLASYTPLYQENAAVVLSGCMQQRAIDRQTAAADAIIEAIGDLVRS